MVGLAIVGLLAALGMCGLPALVRDGAGGYFGPRERYFVAVMVATAACLACSVLSLAVAEYPSAAVVLTALPLLWLAALIAQQARPRRSS